MALYEVDIALHKRFGMMHNDFSSTWREIMRDGMLMRLYLAESDRLKGQPAMQAVLELCRNAGLQGVTVMRGIEGMGLHAVHTSSFLSLSSDLPLVIEAIDTPERIRKAVDALRPHMGNRLLATWPVSVMRAAEED